MVGDSNLLQTSFENNEIGLTYKGSNCHNVTNIIFECFSSLNLYQMNSTLNEYGLRLDLVFSSSNLIKISSTYNSLVPLDRYLPSTINYRKQY